MTRVRTRISVAIASATLLATALAACGTGAECRQASAGAAPATQEKARKVSSSSSATPRAQRRTRSTATVRRASPRLATRSVQPVPPSLKGHAPGASKSPRRAPVAHAAQEPQHPDPNGPSTPEPTQAPDSQNDPKPPTSSSHSTPAAKPKVKAIPTLAASADRFVPGKLTVRAHARVVLLNLSSHALALKVLGRTVRLAPGASKRITMPTRPGRYRISNSRRPAMRVTVTVTGTH
jgi:hypothetical protein